MGGDALDAADFQERILAAYEEGSADEELPADPALARSLIPPATAARRDFWSLSGEIPELIPDACVGCLECVSECPDTAIVARVAQEPRVEGLCAGVEPAAARDFVRSLWASPKKYGEAFRKQGKVPGRFGLFVDPEKCKGCGECVAVCGERKALRMVPKTPELRIRLKAGMQAFRAAGDTPPEYILERSHLDMMLAHRSLSAFCGGAGSCMGCGEATAIRMMLAATRFVHGVEGAGIVAATGCNTVYSSTYPYNAYAVPWTSSLFENASAVAMGVRIAWDRRGWTDKRLWVIGGDGAMYDIGLQSLSRMLASGMDIKVLVLDTQVYSNTGGQASTGTFTAQETKYTAVGRAATGKTERRKELAQIAMMHPDTFVAQTAPAYPGHFYKAVLAANAHPGPAVVVCYSSCQPEHGIADDRSHAQARLAVESRAFPLFVFDPRKGATFRERLDLGGNPSPRQDWWVRPATGETVDFVSFARTEGRFARHFDAQGAPDEALLRAREERLENWRRLRDLAGMLP